MLTRKPVNNDFHQPQAIFELFDGLTVKDIDVPVAAPLLESGLHANGQSNGIHKETNGVSAINGNGAIAAV